MHEYSFDELEAAYKALTSSFHKIEKARETLQNKKIPPKSQITLATRNLEALRLALSLVSDEMERIHMGDGFASDVDVQRFVAFERVYRELADSMVTLPVEMEKLKAEGKEKTVRYRELFGQKLMNNHIVALFEQQGILFDK